MLAAKWRRRRKKSEWGVRVGLAGKGFEELQGNVDEEALLENVHGEDDAFGVGRVIDVAFEAFEGAGDDAHGGAFGEEGLEGELQAGGDDAGDVGELAEEAGFVGHGDDAGEEILLVDAGAALGGNAGKDVAGKEGFGEALGLAAVGAHAFDEGQVVDHALGGHEGGEFFLAAGARVANGPDLVGGGAEGGEGGVGDGGGRGRGLGGGGHGRAQALRR